MTKRIATLWSRVISPTMIICVWTNLNYKINRSIKDLKLKSFHCSQKSLYIYRKILQFAIKCRYDRIFLRRVLRQHEWVFKKMHTPLPPFLVLWNLTTLKETNSACSPRFLKRRRKKLKWVKQLHLFKHAKSEPTLK